MPEETTTQNTDVEATQEAQQENPVPREQPETGTPQETKAPGTESGDPVGDAVEKAARKLKLKIDGVEAEYDEEEVIRMAQTSKAAQKRFNEAAKMKKETAKFIEMLKEDPRAVLEHPDIGVDAKAWAEELLLKELEKAEMSPEAKRAYEAEQKLANLEKEKQQMEEQKKHEEGVRLQAKYVQEYETNIQAALEQVDIPKTPTSVARMAQYMSAALENGVDLDAKQAATLVKQDYMGDVLTLLNKADGDTLLKILGEEIATKIRKTDLARLEAKLKSPAQTEQASGEDAVEAMNYTTDAEAETPKMTTLEWRQKMEEIYKNNK